MARFSDEPLKNPLTGTEVFAGTDLSTMEDIGTNALIITQFAQLNMTLASGSTQGLMSGSQSDKLNALFTQADINAVINDFAQVALPAFFGSPANGFLNYYYHAIGVAWVLLTGYAVVSSGSTNLTLAKNGTPLAGATSIPVTTTGGAFTITFAPVVSTLNQGDSLGVTFAGTTGNCANLIISLTANATILL